MVDDDDDAAESFLNCFRCGNVIGHIHVLAFGPDQALIERIKHDGADRAYAVAAANLLFDVRNERSVVLDQISPPGDDAERRLLISQAVVPAEGLNSF